MKIEPLELAGAALLREAAHEDERGGFERLYCDVAFRAAGLPSLGVQVNFSTNYVRGTLRGLHSQAPPSQEAKLVRCTGGRIYDVIIDLRPSSSTYLRWCAAELSADGPSLLVPSGCAHGFLTLEDATSVLYLMGDVHCPDLAFGIRWDDPLFAVSWPLQPTIVSTRDLNYPDYLA
ncbi:MAG TPA: dTDP-4-dehydrorhamnose 3,5-epimerase family protein [Sphingomicrobium sp.]|nr:dTDP-4-dehydrorhamnose 3,5-epimerase family protein [Sphingomicrobium sp.]